MALEPLLDEIQSLKATYGITSKAAFDYIRSVQEHTSLRDEVVKELQHEGKPFFIPSVREVSNVFNAAIVYANATPYTRPLNDFAGAFEHKNVNTFNHRAFLKDYITAVARTKQPKLDVLEEVLSRHSDEFDLRNIGSYASDLESAPTEEEMLFLYKNQDIQCGLEFWQGGWCLSDFARGALEQTLARLDTERRIALNYILAVSSSDKPPQERIQSALGHLMTFSTMWSPVKANFLRSAETYVRKGLRDGDLSTSDFNEFEQKKLRYTKQAIVENEEWLLKVLSA